MRMDAPYPDGVVKVPKAGAMRGEGEGIAGHLLWRGKRWEVAGWGGRRVGLFSGDISGCTASSGSALGLRNVASEPSESVWVSLPIVAGMCNVHDCRRPRSITTSLGASCCKGKRDMRRESCSP